MDETQDNIIVAIDNDLYYSDEYLALIMEIKMNLLWKNNIYNYLFVKEAPKFILGSVKVDSEYVFVDNSSAIHSAAYIYEDV